MNKEIIYEYLQQFTEDEIFYKKYYFAKKDAKTFDSFIQSLDIKELQEKNFLAPELLPDAIPPYFQESYYFEMGKKCNVILQKHNRYTPAFIHRHTSFEMIYVLYGKCLHTIPPHFTSLTEGDLCLVSPSIAHSIEVFDDDSIIININVKRSTFDDIFFNVLRDKSIISSFFMSNLYSDKPEPYLIFHTATDEFIKKQILDMFIEQFAEDEYTDRILTSQLIIFLTQLMRRHKKKAEVSPIVKARSAEYFEILNYIQENYSSVTLNSIAKHFNYTTQYCSKLIKDTFGHTFSELRLMIRMRRSEILLQTTNMTIADISNSLGFENPETFMRVFKKKKGLTPSQFRIQNIN